MNTGVSLPNADVAYAVQAVIVGGLSDLVINMVNGSKSGSTAWTPGSPQVESATVVVGTVASGNLNVVVTSAGMTGSPLTVPVALNSAVDTTATLVAQKIVDALNANATVSARFTASRATAAVKLTRKPTGNYIVGGVSVPVYFFAGNADDFTIPTALGVTGATSTTGAGADAGVASAGCYVAGDGKDLEGNALLEIDENQLLGYIVKNELVGSPIAVSTSSTMTDFQLVNGSTMQIINENGGVADILTIKTQSVAHITIIVIGTAA
jgi:hypothetical protein